MVLYVFNDLRRKVIVRLDDIGGIVDHHNVSFFHNYFKLLFFFRHLIVGNDIVAKTHKTNLKLHYFFIISNSPRQYICVRMLNINLYRISYIISNQISSNYQKIYKCTIQLLLCTFVYIHTYIIEVKKNDVHVLIFETPFSICGAI